MNATEECGRGAPEWTAHFASVAESYQGYLAQFDLYLRSLWFP